ncbi:MAG: hypothetical protein AAFO61_13955, partial [Pseudomonadota bacterium]
MATVFTTPDGLIALLLLVIFPLALVGFALWMESGRSAHRRGGGGEIVIIDGMIPDEANVLQPKSTVGRVELLSALGGVVS